MKVKELIEILQEEDQEKEITLRVQTDGTALFYLGNSFLDGEYLNINLN